VGVTGAAQFSYGKGVAWRGGGVCRDKGRVVSSSSFFQEVKGDSLREYVSSGKSSLCEATFNAS